MNRTRLLGGFTAASLMLMAGAASAQSSPAQGSRADADRDGRLSKVEFVQARLEPLVAMDSDRDGTVTVAERTAARQARTAARSTQRFERLDADKDGQISRAEFEAAGPRARGARQTAGEDGQRAGPSRSGIGRARPGRHRMHPARHAAGRAAAAAIVIAEVRARAEATFDRLDTDKDGFLVQSERQAARVAARAGARQPGGEPVQGRHMVAGAARAGGEALPSEATRDARREARREARRLRMENVAPASPAPPASE